MGSVMSRTRPRPRKAFRHRPPLYLPRVAEVPRASVRVHILRARELEVAAVKALARAMEARDRYTARHQSRVAALAAAISRELGLAKPQIEAVGLAASVHDIGKLAIPMEILTKPGDLTEFELALVREHARIGHDILSELPFDWPIAEIVTQHHEALDGSGYPYGLRGGDILLEARIIAVADIVDAMSADRPYRTAPRPQAALATIRHFRGIKYDAAVVDACLAVTCRRSDSTFASGETRVAGGSTPPAT